MNDIQIEHAIEIIASLGFPKAQQNERSALCLLALLAMKPQSSWAEASNPLVGITPMMTWADEQYGKKYAPNSRETFRRQSMHQFCDGGLALYNPDKPERPVNSPKAVYQIEPSALKLVQKFGTDEWEKALKAHLETVQTLVDKYAKAREQTLVPVRASDGTVLALTPGDHSELIRQIIEEFAPRFAPNSQLIYAGDTGAKRDFFDEQKLRDLGVVVDSHGKMPDVILHFTEKKLVAVRGC